MNGLNWQHHWRQTSWRDPAEQVTSRLTHSIESVRLPVQASIGHWSSGVQDLLTQPIADWLQAHPLFEQAIDHPLLTLGLLFVVLLLLSGLIQAIARLTEQIWLGILRSPVLLIQWLFAIGGGWLRRKPPAQPMLTPKQQHLTVMLQK
ncbi:MAG: hypothetical protein HC895_07175 [Leptolyngbyaceae cyanobacterium SM1_3_5]|nr:hypothetical protein [Leptolyngbyaceae cyanobacterium SM1_3_5]